MAGVTSISCIRPIFSGQPAEHTLLARTVIVIEDAARGRSGSGLSLLDHFGSVEACITATARELEKVQGIGPKTAAAIRDLVSAETNQPLKGRRKPV